MSNYLTELANKYVSDKGTIAPDVGHHGPRLGYTEIYHEYFDPIRHLELNILEIGIGGGPSLKMWEEYFPNARIIAFDINSYPHLNTDRVKTMIVDQSDRTSLLNAMNSLSTEFDIIIDDGSHVCEHQQISLAVLFKYLRNKGQYWVEDLQTSDVDVWNQNTSLYGYNMGDNIGNKNTVEVFENYGNNKKFISDFLSTEENLYLTENIDQYKLYRLGKTFYGETKLAFFLKK